ncbi:MAG: flavin-containing monooxygenase [Candidatus Competibacterales bacterium]
MTTTSSPQVVIIGAGIAGIAMAVALKRAGIEDFVILDQGERPGGVWRDAVYPGVACDVPADTYAFRFAPNPEWSHRLASGAEIQAYIEAIFARQQLATQSRFATAVSRCEWRDRNWRLYTTRGDTIDCAAVVAATGALRDPHTPSFVGVEKFAGRTVHTARWPADLDLTGQRVAVIGTGSSGCQLIPRLVEQVSQLKLFMRTPPWVYPALNPPVSALIKSFYRHWPSLYALRCRLFSEALLWTYAEIFLGRSPLSQAWVSSACRRALAGVRDPALRERLTPRYPMGCKRIVFSSAFYDALQKPHVEVITTPIEHFDGEGIITADGQHWPVETAIYATGYDTQRFLQPMTVVGRDGALLDERWRRGLRTYYGVCVPTFPNFFQLLGPSSPIANVSSITVAEWQADFVVDALQRAIQAQGAIEVTEAAFARSCREGEVAARRSVWLQGNCSNWYRSGDGSLSVSALTPRRFRAALRRPRWSDFQIVELGQ